MEASVKITSVHLVVAIFTGYICSLISLQMIPGIGNNEILAGVLGIVILYLIGKLCDKLFGKQEGFSKWLWDGILPFAFVWFVVWTILVNYAPLIY
ncbi:hypothetical protein MBCUT_00880 [Methanobrevibacter cuticularis]|uniref:Uncharacterized protein n=1 Tax=Methanobrevibacter cuticularis TaxID=47311 RepID=A0A166FL92_9EURY|nr:hypothetical protein [Methanobrevibacter cuticularis]KZX17793.1 hypothetical protein MBCUT_00880 [Methanobrevibacter cuticularis]